MKLTTVKGNIIELNPLYIEKIKWAWGGAKVYCNGFMGNKVFLVKESVAEIRRMNEEAVKKIAPSTFELIKREFCNF
jgi:uncharacterized protein YlzI (FlbEa/FlbD family)